METLMIPLAEVGVAGGQTWTGILNLHLALHVIKLTIDKPPVGIYRPWTYI